MRRIPLLLMATFSLASSVPAFADVRLQNRLSTSDNGTTLAVRGGITGLTSGAVTVRVRAVGMATIRCGGSSASTREVLITVGAEKTLDPADAQDGTASFELITDEPRTNQLGCRDGQGDVVDVTFRGVTVRVLQDGRVVARRTLSVTP